LDQPAPAYEGAEPYVFVSYSHQDEELVYGEIRWLQDQGIKVWYDTQIQGGSEWSESIAHAIKACSRFLYFISPSSVASENCRREVNFAIEEQRIVLAAFLEETELPDGLRLNLNNRQSIHRQETASFRANLLQAMGQHIPSADNAAPALEKERGNPGTLGFMAAASLLILAASILIYLFAIPGTENETAMPEAAMERDDTAPNRALLRRSFEPRIVVLPTEILVKNDQTQVLRNVVGETAADYDYAGNRSGSVVSAADQDRNLSLMAIAEKYQAGYVVFPRLSQDGSRLHLTARVAETINGTNVSGDALNVNGETASDLQQQLVANIDDLFDVVWQTDIKRIRRIPVEQLNVYEIMYWRAPDRDTHAEYLERAIEENPDYAQTIAFLANHYWWDVIIQHSHDVPADSARAMELARRAYALRSDDWWTMVVLMRVERSFGSAALALGFAEKLLKNKSLPWGDPYNILLADGRAAEVLAHAEQNPHRRQLYLDPLVRGNVLLGNYAQAERYARELLLMPGQSERAYSWLLLADTLGHQGRIAEGREIIDKLLTQPGAIENYLKSQLYYWGDDHTYLKFLEGVEKLGYVIPEVEVIR
jgi:tetratricopeptide (TPR) repeat protein